MTLLQALRLLGLKDERDELQIENIAKESQKIRYIDIIWKPKIGNHIKYFPRGLF